MADKLKKILTIIEMVQLLCAGTYFPTKTDHDIKFLKDLSAHSNTLMGDIFSLGGKEPWESIFGIEENINKVFKKLVSSEIYLESAIFRDMNIEEFKEDATKINLFKLEAIEKYKQLREKVRKDAEEHWK
mmetsp:Transcript_26159/g.23147  ORF Transcript_26159/g.23147 Transcript_26159/m.23147 type:complete len:130 (+) Transcript_26159:3-392(+)